jgi:hypothetical protein
MRRSFFVIFFMILGLIGLVAALRLWQTANTTPLTATPLMTEAVVKAGTATETQVACQIIDRAAAPDLRVALAVDSMYQQMPLFKTPVALVVTEAKPYSVGCIEADK